MKYQILITYAMIFQSVYSQTQWEQMYTFSKFNLQIRYINKCIV